MPLYTFRCRKCGKETQVEHGFNEPHPTTCENMIADLVFTARNVKLYGARWEGGGDPSYKLHLCGGELYHVFDNPNVVYRGSGFYKVDSRLTPVHPDDYNPDED